MSSYLWRVKRWLIFRKISRKWTKLGFHQWKIRTFVDICHNNLMDNLCVMLLFWHIEKCLVWKWRSIGCFFFLIYISIWMGFWMIIYIYICRNKSGDLMHHSCSCVVSFFVKSECAYHLKGNKDSAFTKKGRK